MCFRQLEKWQGITIDTTLNCRQPKERVYIACIFRKLVWFVIKWTICFYWNFIGRLSATKSRNQWHKNTISCLSIQQETMQLIYEFDIIQTNCNNRPGSDASKNSISVMFPGDVVFSVRKFVLVVCLRLKLNSNHQQ